MRCFAQFKNCFWLFFLRCSFDKRPLWRVFRNLFEMENVSSTPTRKHRLVDDEPRSASATPSRRAALHALSESDLNAQPHRHVHVTHAHTAKSRAFPATTPSLHAALLSPVNTARLAVLLALLRERRRGRERAVRGAFFEWLSRTLRSRLRSESRAPSAPPTPAHAHAESAAASAAASLLNTPKKRRVGDAASASQPQSSTGSLAEKLRRLDMEERPPTAHNTPSGRSRTPVHAQSHTPVTPPAHLAPSLTHTVVDGAALHEAMRDATASSLLSLSRYRTRSQRHTRSICKPAAEGEESSLSAPSTRTHTEDMRALTFRISHQAGATDASSYLQQYHYAQPSADPLLPLACEHIRNATSSEREPPTMLPLTALPLLKEKVSQWRASYASDKNPGSRVRPALASEENLAK